MGWRANQRFLGQWYKRKRIVLKLNMTTLMRVGGICVALLIVTSAGCKAKVGEIKQPEILELLRDPDRDVRCRGLEACMGYQMIPPDCIEDVVKQLSDSHPVLRSLAAQALFYCGVEGKPYIDRMQAACNKESDDQTRVKLEDAIYRLQKLK